MICPTHFLPHSKMDKNGCSLSIFVYHCKAHGWDISKSQYKIDSTHQSSASFRRVPGPKMTKNRCSYRCSKVTKKVHLPHPIVAPPKNWSHGLKWLKWVSLSMVSYTTGKQMERFQQLKIDPTHTFLFYPKNWSQAQKCSKMAVHYVWSCHILLEAYTDPHLESGIPILGTSNLGAKIR